MSLASVLNFILFRYFSSSSQVSNVVKDYVDKIAELETECEKLRSHEEDFKTNEKKLINDMKKKGDLARQMLSEKDTYIQQLLSNNGTGSNNGNSNNTNSSHNDNLTGSGKSKNSSSSSGSVDSGGGVVAHGKTENSNITDNHATSISSSSSGRNNSSSNPNQTPLDQSHTAPSTPLNKSSSDRSMSTTPNSQSNSQSQGRDEGGEGRVAVGHNRSVALSQTDQDQQAYLKQAFCGFVRAKEAVEMEHLGDSCD